MSIQYHTLTGVDEKTNLDTLIALSKQYPFVEWGVLYSPKRQGQPGRYPSVPFIHAFLQSLPHPMSTAIHFCGDGVNNLLDSMETEYALLRRISERKGRVQLNFNQVREPIDLSKLARFIKAHSDITFITQHNSGNQAVWQIMQDAGCSNHAVLFDNSGGKGISCDDWPNLLPLSCGYAGGLGQDNLEAELTKIQNLTGNKPFWIDMEGKLRQSLDGVDWFNLDVCHQCLNITHEFLTKNGHLYLSITTK